MISFFPMCEQEVAQASQKVNSVVVPLLCSRYAVVVKDMCIATLSGSCGVLSQHRYAELTAMMHGVPTVLSKQQLHVTALECQAGSPGNHSTEPSSTWDALEAQILQDGIDSTTSLHHMLKIAIVPGMQVAAVTNAPTPAAGLYCTAWMISCHLPLHIRQIGQCPNRCLTTFDGTAITRATCT